MPRKSEVTQMNIQREFCSTMQVLREIWDEIGIPDDQVESRGNTVLKHIRNLLNDMVTEEQNLKATMLAKIKKHKSEIEDLEVKLQVSTFKKNKNLTIMQEEKALRNYASRLNQIKKERICSLASMKAIEQELCDQLCATPCYIPSGSIPSEGQLNELKEHIETLNLEKNERKNLFMLKKAEIVCMYDELCLAPETSFAQDLIMDEMDSFCLSTGKMDELERLRINLATQKRKVQIEADALWSMIKLLWQRLETPTNEREEILKKCNGIKPDQMNSLKKVLEKLEEEKLSNLQRFTEKTRSEIATLWDKCFFSAQQRGLFTSAYDENYTEELLEEHEEELATLQIYYEERQEMFTNVNKWQELFQRMLELEANARDINRYSNRGGKLLQEERERKKIHKQLPKLQEKLLSTVEQWEEKNGKPFHVEGTRFADYVHSQWEACEQRKKSEKQIRHEKKQQELQSEMAFGRTPLTPTKRHFIGTANVMKALADSAEKQKRGPMDCTWRSAATLQPGNKTTHNSPGKSTTHLQVPIKENLAPKVPAAKRALFESRLNHQSTKTGANSTKSAPTKQNCDSDTNFIEALSTTVMQSNTAGSVQSLSDGHETPYCDFSTEIKSIVKENHFVRSSAIGDYVHN